MTLSSQSAAIRKLSETVWLDIAQDIDQKSGSLWRLSSLRCDLTPKDESLATGRERRRATLVNRASRYCKFSLTQRKASLHIRPLLDHLHTYIYHIAIHPLLASDLPLTSLPRTAFQLHNTSPQYSPPSHLPGSHKVAQCPITTQIVLNADAHVRKAPERIRPPLHAVCLETSPRLLG